MTCIICSFQSFASRLEIHKSILVLFWKFRSVFFPLQLVEYQAFGSRNEYEPQSANFITLHCSTYNIVNLRHALPLSTASQNLSHTHMVFSDEQEQHTYVHMSAEKKNVHNRNGPQNAGSRGVKWISGNERWAVSPPVSGYAQKNPSIVAKNN